ncbi:hypothetical protein SAMN05421827_108167 [Pedobacter terrae]|uniref:Magnesium citrate secondary transporter n=1 Tax=Pedobacter terrae TaxID=405671 RepID=A0A1G7VNV5_9SPHI|nr:hypothetical protein SAMN05421827_108167 [Pedobacter terrae]
MRENIWFFSLSAVGILVYVGNRLDYVFPTWIQFYLNDLLIVPITAILARRAMQKIFRLSFYRLQIWQIIFIVFFYAVLFEAIMPLINERYTADWLDVSMYIAGGVFYQKILEKNTGYRRIGSGSRY